MVANICAAPTGSHHTGSLGFGDPHEKRWSVALFLSMVKLKPRGWFKVSMDEVSEENTSE